MNESESPYKGATGLRRLISATRNSIAGFAEAVRHEDAFRQELIFAAVFVPLGLWLGRTGVERALLVGSLAKILMRRCSAQNASRTVSSFRASPLSSTFQCASTGLLVQRSGDWSSARSESVMMKSRCGAPSTRNSRTPLARRPLVGRR